jgi:hypothetical protein
MVAGTHVNNPHACHHTRLLRSHFANTYGPSWKQPHTTWHGQSWVTRDGNTVRDALVEWLSLTAWGGMPWALRRQRCAELFGADFDYWPN